METKGNGASESVHSIRVLGAQDSPGMAAWRPASIQLSSVIVGLALHLLWPVAIPLAAAIGWAAGPTIIGLGAVVIAWSFRQFAKRRTTLRPDRGANALIRTGPFRYSRNPLYVSVCLLHVGIALWVNSFWILSMVVVTIVVMSRAVIAPEEKYLEREFGGEYTDFEASVRRWL